MEDDSGTGCGVSQLCMRVVPKMDRGQAAALSRGHCVSEPDVFSHKRSNIEKPATDYT